MVLSVVCCQFTHRLGRPHYVWDEYLYSILEEVEVRMTVCVTVCVVLLCCVGWWWWWKEGRRWNPVPAHSLLFSKSTKGAAWLNVPIRQTNRYQQYYMPSQHTYCGRVWNLIQDFIQYNRLSYSSKQSSASIYEWSVVSGFKCSTWPLLNKK